MILSSTGCLLVGCADQSKNFPFLQDLLEELGSKHWRSSHIADYWLMQSEKPVGRFSNLEVIEFRIMKPTSERCLSAIDLPNP